MLYIYIYQISMKNSFKKKFVFVFRLTEFNEINWFFLINVESISFLIKETRKNI